MHIESYRFLLRDFSEADRHPFIAYQMDPRYRRLYDFSESDEQRANALFDLFGVWRQQTPRQNFQIGSSGPVRDYAGARASVRKGKQREQQSSGLS